MERAKKYRLPIARKFLNQVTKKYSDEETGKISDLLYKLGELDYRISRDMNKSDNSTHEPNKNCIVFSLFHSPSLIHLYENVVLYVRVITDEQVKLGYSLDHQKMVLTEFSELKEFEEVNIFRENHSAKFYERPKYKKFSNSARLIKRKLTLC